MQANSHIKYNVVSLAFDENSLMKAQTEVPRFIGSNKYGSGFDNVVPRSICTDQQFFESYQAQNEQETIQFMLNEVPKFGKFNS